MSKTKVLYNTIYNDMCSYFRKYYPVSDEMCEAFFECCSLEHFKRGDLLVAEEMECNCLYFILQGFCSCYYVKDGKEYVLNFSQEGDFCLLPHSFLGGNKSLLNIKAMKKTMALCLRLEDFERLGENYPDFVKLFYHVLKGLVIKYEEREYRIRSNDAEGRIVYYQNIHELQHLLQHVPQYCVASWLNMTPETFAKILGRLNKTT